MVCEGLISSEVRHLMPSPVAAAFEFCSVKSGLLAREFLFQLVAVNGHGRTADIRISC
jgi:hypothetical protein